MIESKGALEFHVSEVSTKWPHKTTCCVTHVKSQRSIELESKPCFSPNPRKQQLEHGITITTVVDSIEGDLHSLRQDESYKKANEHL